LLPEGSTRSYKRGHKNRVPITPVSSDEFSEEGGLADQEETFFTLDDAARETPDDPEPKDQPEFKAKTEFKITAAVRRDIEGKLAFGFMMLGQAWALPDPPCGMTLVEHSANIAKKATPVLCQSPEVVKWLSKGGKFILWIDLLMAMTPVLQVVYAHHIAHTLGGPLGSANGQARTPADIYVVQ